MIWVTRSAPDNKQTTARLSGIGVPSVCVPVLFIKPIEARDNHPDVDGLIFTSLNGVRHHPVCDERLELPVFAVGDRTAQATRALGYRRVCSARGDIRDLEKLIRERVSSGKTLLHYGARHTAGNLVETLGRDGYTVLRTIVYEAQAIGEIDIRRSLPEWDALRGVLIHSPRAALIVSKLLEPERSAFSGTVYCISSAAAQAFDHLDVPVRTANRPNEDDLLSLISPEA